MRAGGMRGPASEGELRLEKTDYVLADDVITVRFTPQPLAVKVALDSSRRRSHK